jgi:general secretion pathway protein M
MNLMAAFNHERSRLIAAAIYCVAIVGALSAAAYGLVGLAESYGMSASSSDRLAQLEGRVTPPPMTLIPSRWPPNAPTGSPFLEGDTVTVAGATLLQRVTSAIGRAGGTMLSSQIELQTTSSGRIGLVLSAELNHAALQGLLYDIEAGMPFLFVDQLLVQGPSTGSGADGANARLTMTVHGQWRNGR